MSDGNVFFFFLYVFLSVLSVKALYNLVWKVLNKFILFVLSFPSILFAEVTSNIVLNFLGSWVIHLCEVDLDEQFSRCANTETASILVICVLTERQEHVTLTLFYSNTEWAVKSCCLSLTASPSSLPPSIHVCMFDLSRTLPLHKATAGSMVSFDIGPWAICVRYVGRKRLAVLELLIKPSSFVQESAACRVWKPTAVY